MPEPREVISARFPPDIAAAAKRAAAAEGKSVSEWISELAVIEIARRENRCPSCGHELACGGGEKQVTASR